MERPTPFADVVFHGCEPNRGLPFWAAEPHTKEPVMDEGTTYVGMDVHKRTIAVSIRLPDGTRDERTIPHETRAVNRLVRKMKREASGTIACAYEAGPCCVSPKMVRSPDHLRLTRHPIQIHPE